MIVVGGKDKRAEKRYEPFLNLADSSLSGTHGETNQL
jgi:hypothetical protein